MMSDKWLTIGKPMIAFLFALAGFIGGRIWPSADVERQTDVQFVSIAIEILSESPTETAESLRKWAIGVVNEHSAVQIEGEAEEHLLGNAWNVKPLGPWNTPFYLLDERFREKVNRLDPDEATDGKR